MALKVRSTRAPHETFSWRINWIIPWVAVHYIIFINPLGYLQQDLCRCFGRWISRESQSLFLCASEIVKVTRSGWAPDPREILNYLPSYSGTSIIKVQVWPGECRPAPLTLVIGSFRVLLATQSTPECPSYILALTDDDFGKLASDSSCARSK